MDPHRRLPDRQKLLALAWHLFRCRKPRCLANLPPWTPNGHACSFLSRKEGKGSAGCLYAAQQLQCGVAQRRMLDLFLFGVVARFCPDTSLEVELVPGGVEYFAFAGASDDQQPDGISRGLIWIAVQRFKKVFNLLTRQPGLTLVFVVTGNALCRVVRSPTPFHRKAEHLREQRQHTIGAIGRRLQSVMQAFDVAP